MNKAGFSGEPQHSSAASGDDIPAALRDAPDAKPKVGLKPMVLLVGGVLAFVLLAVSSGFVFFILSPKRTANSQPSPTSLPTPTSESSANSQSTNTDTVLGHLTYAEAPESELAVIPGSGRIRMRKTAAEKFQEMKQAARSAGVILVPISGFRSVKEQEQLFFGVGAQRNQTPAERAALSAPPGHSEHHTGYAVDVGDGAVPATNLQANFDNTKAYQWLEANAARFGFEMSFPKDNAQGVSYEPWHWRFVGDRDSLETFYKAKNLKPTPKPETTPK
ncbi:peptidase M15B and M15C, D,D-carboxypeptidase VanY/endolysin [Tolypothrix tenuis PCC 7101]|uniref:Peptidase M15B and M15C, D,D-carboxypeptidase VanY/endolysin n=1 Tax=Tolypothrix tenuis PCC 7101 TaxID=231146 RepID=A0A1Z4N006_9CYAN|nr:D-alanyl-D-alanine carboxypeptidase family protein [Aulosira sp. FACHB-113]BAY99055.1 peptidase M15B and M15C, D,D-carboxypeptidase VanY/endolysin [Tolypothrix tenuis PCC 7101]BAZ77024.1 peptidase M15B and M15C, D,D-carboxypeptidase VanY/endolysin [Aulosira laxa NIES-50]